MRGLDSPRVAYVGQAPDRLALAFHTRVVHDHRRRRISQPLIDLHLHTTASDGHCSPRELLERAHDAGIRTISVTDHDTMAAVAEARAQAASFGIDVVPGIEITSVWRGKDVHLLGYFLDPVPPGLEGFLVTQRQARLDRIRAIAGRLTALGMPVSPEAVTRYQPDPNRSLGRPHVARALVQAGYVATIDEAFDRWLGESQPAFVPRDGPTPAHAIEVVIRAGGVASLAHPGLQKRDHISRLVPAGLGAVEVYHSHHDRTTERRLLRQAQKFGLAVTGGSDYHGDLDARGAWLGRIGLPAADFRTLRDRLSQARAEAR